jgi:lipoyl(octanoyl) transferase
VRAGTTSITVDYPPLVSSGAYLLDAGLVPYRDGLELQRSLAAAVLERAIPETIVLLAQPPVHTTGRRTEEAKELHIPAGAEVDLVETDRGGKSTYHAPGQLVCYPILDLTKHGKDVREYVRDLEQAIVQTVAACGLEATTIVGLTGVWMPPAGSSGPRKIASIGVRVSRWVTTHGYALNVDLDPAPFTEWITACGLDDAEFTTMARELGRPVTVDEVKPAALEALAGVFGLELAELPADDRAALWTKRAPERLTAR